jgi:hypothetical protein
MAFAFTKSRFLLCEGDDDKGFFEALIANRPGIPEFQVRHSAECNTAGQDGRGVGGRSGFRYSLDSGIRVFSGFGQLRAVLIVSDNDTNTSFRDVQTEVEEAGHTPPPATNAVGSIIGKPLAVLMVPTENARGDLESLSLPAIYQTWPKARICVPLFLRCTGALKYFGGSNWPKRASISKARARAATVGFNADDPYKGIGRLFQSGTLSVNHPCFDGIADFLTGFDAFCGI